MKLVLPVCDAIRQTDAHSQTFLQRCSNDSRANLFRLRFVFLFIRIKSHTHTHRLMYDWIVLQPARSLADAGPEWNGTALRYYSYFIFVWSERSEFSSIFIYHSFYTHEQLLFDSLLHRLLDSSVRFVWLYCLLSSERPTKNREHNGWHAIIVCYKISVQSSTNLLRFRGPIYFSFIFYFFFFFAISA